MLVAAIEAGNGAVIKEISEAGVDINMPGQASGFIGISGCCAPLTMAILKRNWILVDQLRDAGAYVNNTCEDPGPVKCMTPLWAAAYQKNFRLARSLIEEGAEVYDQAALEAATDDEQLLKLFVGKLAISRNSNFSGLTTSTG